MYADRRAALAWLALGIIWGSNFIFMKWATELITPLQVVLYRVAFGLLPIAVFALATRQLHLSHLKYSVHFAVMALLAAAIYYYGFARGTSLLPSGIAGAASGAIPIFSVLAAAALLPEERLDRWGTLGLVVGLTGVVVIARPFDSGLASGAAEGVAFIVIGALSLGVSFVYARRFVTPLRLSAVALATYQLAFATLILVVFTPFEGIGLVMQRPITVVGLVIGLGLLGTGIAFILYYYIVSRLGAVAASSVSYLPPVVALLIGALLVREPITGLDYLATTFIFAGVVLLNRRRAA